MSRKIPDQVTIRGRTYGVRRGPSTTMKMKGEIVPYDTLEVQVNGTWINQSVNMGDPGSWQRVMETAVDKGLYGH